MCQPCVMDYDSIVIIINTITIIPAIFIYPALLFSILFRKRRKKVSIHDTEVGPNPNPGQSKPHIPLDKSDWLENWSVPQAGLSPDCKIEADIMVSCYSDKGLKI